MPSFAHLTTLCFLLLTLFHSLPDQLMGGINYEVFLSGELTHELHQILEDSSQLIALRDRPPPTMAALRSRAEADIPNLIAALQGQAYFEAEVTVRVEEKREGAHVYFLVDPQKRFTLRSFSIFVDDSRTSRSSSDIQEKNHLQPFFSWVAPACYTLDGLGVKVGEPAFPDIIVDAEKRLLSLFLSWGYVFSSISDRKVIADVQTKLVDVIVEIQTGPLAYFGPVRIQGNRAVRSSLIFDKICWQRGARYDPLLIDETLCAIDDLGLFRSIQITPVGSSEQSASLPILIDLEEGKQRSIGFGVSYTTQQGVGVVGEWEHRNVRGLGELIRFKGELLQKLQCGSLLYLKPYFFHRDQKLLLRAHFEREITKGFDETSLTLMAKARWEPSLSFDCSYGLAFKYLFSDHSDNNRRFTLVKFPFELRWSNVENSLDPTSGAFCKLECTPTLQVIHPRLLYHLLAFDGAFYLPFMGMTVAMKVSAGSILGASRLAVPPPERFYTGTPYTLRGYRYMTVSPLDREGKPIGGRSLMVYSLEIRRRFFKEWGFVLFYEFGNVYAYSIPSFDRSLLHSVGAGLRYYTAVGPIRLDIAFPINPRPRLDRAFQVYFSIGQTF